MKHWLSLLLLSLGCTIGLGAQSSADPYIQELRKQHILSMIEYESNPPISWKDTALLSYYPNDRSWKVRATFHPMEKDTFCKLTTSSGSEKVFRILGHTAFIKNDTLCELTIFQPFVSGKLMPYWFIPFYDASNGSMTYGGGRYVEGKITSISTDSIVINFNASYNPWCAYHEGYQCPIPPRENELLISVQAGEKVFHKDGRN